MEQLQKKTIPAQTVVCLEHMGSHDQIGAVYHDLNAWVKKNSVKPAGPAFTVFLDAPNESDIASGRFEVCLPVAAAPKVDGKLKVKSLPACTVAYSQVKGPYQQIPAHYSEMLAWLDAQGWQIAGAPREVYIKHPEAAGKAPSKDYLTEIQFPISE